MIGKTILVFFNTTVQFLSTRLIFGASSCVVLFTLSTVYNFSHVSYAQWPRVQYITTCHLCHTRRRHPLFLRSHWTCPRYHLHSPLRSLTPSSSTSTETPKEPSLPSRYTLKST